MSPSPSPAGLPAPALPPRANAARLLMYIGAPLSFLTVLAFAGASPQAAVALLGPAILFAGIMVFVGSRVARDHGPAPAVESDPELRRRSRWNWTDVLGLLPATLALLALTSSVLVGGTRVIDGGLSTQARLAVESFAAQAAFYAAALLALFVLLVLRRTLRLPDIGWRLPRSLGRAGPLPWLVIAVVAALAALWVSQELGILAQQLLPNSPNTQCTSVRDEYGGYIAVAIPLVCVVAPLAEETLFRGFLYGWLRRHLPVIPAIVVCSAVFALSHAVLVLALPLFAVGVILALLYEYSNSLIPGALVHSLFNLVGILAILGTTATC